MSSSMMIMMFYAAIIAAVPLLYAAIGEVFSQRSGVINLGLEGVMLMGAVTAFSIAVQTSSIGLTILGTIGVGILLGILYGFLTVTLQANQIVSGLALTMFGTGLSGFIGKDITGIPSPIVFSKLPIPFLSDIPVIGKILFTHDIFVYALYLIIPISFIYMYGTRYGLLLRSVGENPAAVDVVGKSVPTMRYIYICFGCGMTAIGGAYLSLVYSPSWLENMTAGRGWIALALVIFATWNPALAAVGALLFGGIDVLGMRMQAIGIDIPSYFIKMLPYAFTIFVLIVSTGDFGKKSIASPKALGIPYNREDR